MSPDIDPGIKQLQDEQFCQAFELKALGDLLIRKATERWVPGFADASVELEHRSRYAWVSNYVNDKRVFDIACGTGAGSYILAQEGKAREVVGCDLSPDSVRYASIRNKHPRVSFVTGDARQFRDGTEYDAVVSFETIEHLPDADAFLKNIAGMLVKGGRLYVSTPVSKRSLDKSPANVYHVREWGFKEFQELISKYFTLEEVYLQMRAVDCASVFARLRHRASVMLGRDPIRAVKKKYLSGGMAMRPVRYENSDHKLFELNYVIAGYQILVARR